MTDIETIRQEFEKDFKYGASISYDKTYNKYMYLECGSLYTHSLSREWDAYQKGWHACSKLKTPAEVDREDWDEAVSSMLRNAQHHGDL